MSLFSRRPPDPRVLADPSRLPPGQVLTEKWPVLHYGSVPHYGDMAAWRLRLYGAVGRETVLTYDEVRALPSVDITCDIHCVTTWSRLDNVFTGVAFPDILALAEVRDEAQFAVFRCAQGFTTSVPLALLRDRRTGLVWAHQGQDLAPEHGWPLRALVPRRYFWKSAKWVEAVEFAKHDELGFWERNGYNNSADPWLEERYW